MIKKLILLPLESFCGMDNIIYIRYNRLLYLKVNIYNQKYTLDAGEEGRSVVAERRTMAFMSYAHFADEHDKGYLTELCKRLSGEVELLSGEEFPIFQDREDIEWGESWKGRIEDSLDNTTFLIAIITPGFFKSDYCRNELKRFMEREKELVRNDLVLPIYYVETPLLEDKSRRVNDKLAEIVASHQYTDWRELRFEELESKLAKKAINKMASQICKALDRTDQRIPRMPEHEMPAAQQEHGPGKASDWLDKGDALYNYGMYDDAVKAYDRAIELDPKYTDAWYGKGIALGNLGMHDDAIKAYDKAIELDPNYEKAWYGRGIALGDLDNHDDAIKAYDKAIELDPKDKYAWYGKGFALGNLGNHDDAIKAYDKAIELDPKYTDAWYSKGIALGNLGMHDDAAKAYDRAIELDPKDKYAWFSKGFALGNLGNHNDAIKAYDKAIELDPKYADAWYSKGDALKSLGRNTEAKEAYAKAKEARVEG